jgi:hypothetical protein
MEKANDSLPLGQGVDQEESPSHTKKCATTALTQLNGHYQRCANLFCKHSGVFVMSSRGKHGRYCCPQCRMDGYVLRRAKQMLREVGIIEFNDRLMDIES